jgi:hypothetical protein
MVARASRSERRFDTRSVSVNDEVTVGLFRDADVRAAVHRGQRSDTCARQLVLRCIDPGRFQVIEDTFNPRHGYFVSADYDRGVWESEQLPPHSEIRIGSIRAGESGPELEPVLYPAGRADVETESGLVEGKLRVGFVVLGQRDVFAD